MVELARHHDIAAVDRETAAGIIEQREGGGVAGVRIDIRQCTDHGARSAVLRYAVVRQQDVGRSAVARGEGEVGGDKAAGADIGERNGVAAAEVDQRVRPLVDGARLNVGKGVNSAQPGEIDLVAFPAVEVV